MNHIKRNRVTKYIALFAMFLNILCLPLSGTALAGEQAPAVVVNGQALVMDVNPLIENYRILVPVRAISEALGAEVAWNGEQQMVSATRAGSTVSFVLGQTLAYKDGSEITMDVVPSVVNERVLVPLRFFSEAFGAQVDWKEDTFEAIVNLAAETVPVPQPLAETVTYDQAGTFGPASGQETVEANVSIAADGIILRNMIVKGDLTIEPSVEEGAVDLNNVQVEGTVYVRGGGPNSAEFNNCTLYNVVVEKNGVRIISSGSTTVHTITLENGATLVEISGSNGEGFQQVIVNSGEHVYLEGDFTSVTINSISSAVEISSGNVQTLTVGPNATGVELNLASGCQVGSLTLNGVCSVMGSGEIGQATVNATGCSFQNMPANLINNTSAPIVVNPAVTSTVSISNIEANNTFGGFKFTTSQVVTADELAGKIKAGSITAGSFEQRGANNGKEWKGVFPGVSANQSYSISCLSPLVLSGSASLIWTDEAPPVTGLTASYDGSIHAVFTKADGENQRVASYRIFVVKSGSSLSLDAANNAATARYTSVSKTNGSYNISVSTGSKDSDGNSISAGNTYVVYVLTVADGTNAKSNCLTGPSNSVVIPAVTISDSGGDGTPPVFAAGYPNLSGIAEDQAVLNGQINESGTIYYAVLADGAAAPTSAQVKNGQDSAGNAALKSGSRTLAADTAGSSTITGLSPSTAYDVYAVAQDGSDNLQASPSKVDLTTLAAQPATLAKAEFTSQYSGIALIFSEDINQAKYNPFTTDASIIGAFIVKVGGVVFSVKEVDKTNTSTKIKVVPNSIVSGSNVTIEYVQPGDSSKRIVGADGLDVASFGPIAVVEGPPVYDSYMVSGGDIYITFDKKVQSSNIANTLSGFTVTVDSVGSPVSGVSLSAPKVVKLTMQNPITAGTVKLSYGQPTDAGNRLRGITSDTAYVDNFSNKTITI